MSASNDPIRLYEVGEYGELTARPNPHDLVIVQFPPVEDMLEITARRLGRELSLEEIEAERRQAPSMVLTKAEAENVIAARAKSR